MKIFADLHHAGLYASLKYLFEDRLGYELYRPIGMEWYDKGYWKLAGYYNNAPQTIHQYLSINPLLSADKGYYELEDSAHHITTKGLTWAQFLNTEIDVMIASIPEHIECYLEVVQKYKAKAKFVYQIGNVGWHTIIPWDKLNNVMASVKTFEVPEGKNAVFYRQEFDLAPFSIKAKVENKIASFVNCMPQKEKFERLKGLLPDYKFQAHGIDGHDGVISGLENIAKVMRSCKFGYHNKPEGDGYGHIIHNWFAAGVPIIVNMKDYENKLAGEMLKDMDTCIDMSDGNVDRVAGIVRELNDNDYYTMCKNVKNVFENTVDFRRDAISVDKFLARLI